MPRSNIEVMIIDDQKTIRMILRKLLSEADIYNITEGHNGEHALEVLSTSLNVPPDIIICDLHMDIMDGMEFVRHLRRKKNATPVIMLTGEKDGLVHEVSLQVGVAKVLTKPVTSPELYREICAAIGFEGGL